MANQRRRKKKIPVRGTIALFVLVAVLGLIFLISSGGKIYKSSKANAAEIDDNVKILKELSEKTPRSAASESVPSEPAEPAPEPKTDVDLSAEEAKIMSITMNSYNDAELRKWFEGNVILGDSITMAAAEYGFLDYDVIVAKIGGGLTSSDDLFEEAIAKYPQVLFMCFGANDISNYLGDPNLFISQYSAAVDKLRASLPDTVFYLHAIMPVEEGVYYEEGFEYREAYNQALKEYCDKTDKTYYINSDFILQQNPDLYDADGMHPTGAFYPPWLTYLADMSGLSGNH